MTSTITLWFVGFIRLQRAERPAAVAAEARALSIVQARAFSTRVEPITMLLHAAGGASVDVDTLNRLRRQMGTGQIPSWHEVVVGCLLAELYGEASAPERGLEVLASLQDAGLTYYYGSEVYDGELRRKLSSSGTADAERSFEMAVHLARRREERSLELRATISLARLWRDRGQREDAQRVLAGVYGWFTEGFDTADLRDAKTLLDELAPVEVKSPMSSLLAHCHLGLGKLYRHTGKRDQAHEHLTTATTMYHEMDMRFWLEQAEAEMRD
jgi:hypothetical protein